MSTSLYTGKGILTTLKDYFSAYFAHCTKPTIDKLFLFVLALLAVDTAPSIRFLFRHFLLWAAGGALSSWYYLFGKKARIDDAAFLEVTVRKALDIVPPELRGFPILLCLDDTMVSKAGRCIEGVSKLFDHAAHNGKNWLIGHCFVSLTICVPVWKYRLGKPPEATYLAIPLGYRMWQDSRDTKFAIAGRMIRQAMKVCQREHVVLLCDAWYACKPIFDVTREFRNLDVVCNAKKNTVMYAMGKPWEKIARGRYAGQPRKHGERIRPEDFVLDRTIGKYAVGWRMVKTNIGGDDTLYAYVSRMGNGELRLFLSTLKPESLHMCCNWMENAELRAVDSKTFALVPLLLYRFRWNIEIGYYEHKTFWSLCDYMIRHKCGIERLLNLITIAYASVKILPYAYSRFSSLKECSPQDARFIIGKQILMEIHWAKFVQKAEFELKSENALERLRDLADAFLNAA